MNEVNFQDALDKILDQERNRNGIGTLQEKTVHAVLKHYLASDINSHEIPIEGFVADIFNENEIIEIQTRNFDKLRRKLTAFLPLYPVTVVYPIPHEKWLIWIDETTGEYSTKRKSPVKGNPYLAFSELYKIKKFLTHENFQLKIILLDMEEYRLLNGWSKDKKKGSIRFDRIPFKLIEEIDILHIKDYMQLIPEELNRPFSNKDFSKYLHIKTREGQITLNILYFLGILNRVGKDGNSYLYDVSF